MQAYGPGNDMIGDFLNSENPRDLLDTLPSKILIDCVKFFYNLVDIINNSPCNRVQEVQLLTLFSSSMSTVNIKEYLNVCDRSIILSCDLFNKKGILALSEPKRGIKFVSV